MTGTAMKTLFEAIVTCTNLQLRTRLLSALAEHARARLYREGEDPPPSWDSSV